MKRIEDLQAYSGTLPYASETFGIYQPLLGWRSKRIEERNKKGFQNDRKRALELMVQKFIPNVQIDLSFVDHCEIDPHSVKLSPGLLLQGEKKKMDSVLLESISAELPSVEEYDDRIWEDVLSDERIEVKLKEVVAPHFLETHGELCRNFNQLADVPEANREMLKKGLVSHLNYESSLAGMLQFMRKEKNTKGLKELFYKTKDTVGIMAELSAMVGLSDPKELYLGINNIDPRDKENLLNVGLSPLSVVHLFRQYFFEFDTFLGSPVGHIWLSPGSTVELVEVSTRRIMTEKVIEQSLESIHKTEDTITNKDEISEAIKKENRNETKFGANANIHQGWIGGEANASATLDFNSTQVEAREKSYKQMREQSSKQSAEIRQNFKSTFKTITETTDTSSKKYLLSNSTDKLLNYELRRKMRQVGVQVQDIGTFLCWQTYVDDPGAQLGISELVHIAKKTDVEGKPKIPSAIQAPEPETVNLPTPIPFVGAGDDNDDKEETYVYGKEENEDDEEDKLLIQHIFPKEVSYNKPYFMLSNVSYDTQDAIELEFKNIRTENGLGKFDLVIKRVNFEDRSTVNVNLKLYWTPDPLKYQAINDAAMEQYKKDIAEYNAAEALQAEKDFIGAARERIKLASKIVPRKFEDLREEERIVVYRQLVQSMLMKGISFPDDQTRHVVAELINSIFDIDKMLYFVAPEWWRPRLHHSHQNLGSYKKPSTDIIYSALNLSKETSLAVAKMPAFANMLIGSKQPIRPQPLKDHITGWGGMKNDREDNYYITDESDRARMGSSLGWLLQLDGDNLRNAFLNAPWVKAVIPIRPGREEAALNWLQKVEGTNGIGDGFLYHTDNPAEKSTDGQPLNGMPMLDVLKDLAKKVNKKYKEGLDSGKYPKQDPNDLDAEPVDPATTVTATPVDRVYEHGFYPLQGGFRNKVAENDPNFQTISQWVEILPTDQVVAVEVEYDPISGRQKKPVE